MASTIGCAAAPVRKAAADTAFDALRKAETDLSDVICDLENRLSRVATPECPSMECMSAPAEPMPEYFSEIRFTAERIDGMVLRLRSLYRRIEL